MTNATWLFRTCCFLSCAHTSRHVALFFCRNTVQYKAVFTAERSTTQCSTRCRSTALYRKRCERSITPLSRKRLRALKPRLHDTTGCQTDCTAGLTTGWMFVYTMRPDVQPAVQLNSRLYNRFNNRFYNRLYHVNGA